MRELRFSAIEDIKVDFREYVRSMQERLEHVGKSVLDMQAKLQSEQASKHMEKVKQPNKYREGLLVYLNAPSASSLKTNTLKFKSDFVGPLWIKELLGQDKAILCTLDGKILHGVFHVNRLKPGFIRLANGCASHIDEVRRAYTDVQIAELHRSPTADIQSAGEHAGAPPTVAPHTAAACSMQVLFNVEEEVPYTNMPTECILTDSTPSESVNPLVYMDNLKKNKNLGAPHAMTYRQTESLKRHGRQITKQGEDLKVTKIRCKDGHLQLCLKGDNTDPAYAFWYEPRAHPNNSRAIGDFLLKTKMKVHGSLRKQTKQKSSLG